ncbi:MAG: hypothetical protein LC645_05515 [Geobacteraceae bacterium]|nr:hypothetical protein [Geobacteraceae bacterium]
MKRNLAVLLFVVVMLFSAFPVCAASEARIAVAAEEPRASARVSPVAARCAWFLLFDKNGEFIESVANPFRDASGAAAAQVVKFLADSGVDLVIAGNFGAKMLDNMASNGMRHLEFSGTVIEGTEEALQQ